jgi:membrane associated rhomboid family serine protease
MGIHDRSYYRDEGLPPVAPWDQRSMVSMLIIVNVGLFLANFVLTGGRSNAITNLLALEPEVMGQPWQWYRVVSYGFAHSSRDIMHIVFNMASLYFLGRSVEERYGKWEFMRFYLVAIALGGLYWTLKTWGGTQGMLGASGGVTAVCMLFVFCFPRVEILLMGVIPVPAWVLGVLIIVGNMLGGRGGVAYDVHLVGAAFATLYFYGNLNFGFLENVTDRMKTSLRQKQRGFKVRRPDDLEEPQAPQSKDEVEADRILAKIHQEGQDSLTAAERKFMESYSRRVRERRAKHD